MVDRDTEEQLDLDQIQGDILVGLQKEVEAFVGFAIADVVRFKRFLKGLHLTTARDAIVAQNRIDAFRQNGGKGLLDIRGVNIAFTVDGLKKLGVADIGKIKDVAFHEGLAKRSLDLGDPPTGDGAAPNWLVGNGIGELDGLLIITGRDNAAVAATLADLDMAAGSGTWVPVFTEIGNTRPGDQHGHEHFGYLDGVSQPAVRGRIDHFFPNHKFLDPNRGTDPNQGLPGADLHWPGEFVFGYQEQDRTNIEKTVGPKDGGIRWMRNGSFMVFRRLEQFVPEAHTALLTIATDKNTDPELLAARGVGRFKSGTPTSLSPSKDAPQIGGDPMKNNDFEFGSDDIEGLKCPYFAHIRKSYPRNEITPAAKGDNDQARHDSSEADTQTHRIMRRGIPFGKEVQPGETTTSFSRGLMFVCYQTSITDQFEFIIRNWVNNPGFAVTDAGLDPVLGQAKGAARKRTFTGALPGSPSGHPPTVILDTDFVRPTGGGYFFMPSIQAIQTALAE